MNISENFDFCRFRLPAESADGLLNLPFGLQCLLDPSKIPKGQKLLSVESSRIAGTGRQAEDPSVFERHFPALV